MRNFHSQPFSILILLVLQAHYLFAQVANLDTLQLVQVIFRHGERVPEYPYPTDPYNSEDFWKEGWAQLTEVGKEQEYRLGQYLRTRYQSFVSDHYVPKQIYVLSSDTDRTIMSAELCIAGMFPAVNGTSWDPDLKWQPVPLHTISQEHDNLLRNKKKCPRYDEESQDLVDNSEEFKKINEDNADLFKYLTEHSGVNVTSINEIDSFYATMMVEEMLGLEVPEWAKPVIYTENFQYLYNLSFYARSGTTELKRLRTGPLLKDLRSHFDERITNSSSRTKMSFYSAHDITLTNVLNALEANDNLRPTYAAVIMMELHKEPENGTYYVNLLYRNDTSRDPYNLKLPGCDLDCPYDEFLKFVEPLIPEDWDKECESQALDHLTSQLVTYFISAVLAIIIIGFGTYLTCRLCKKKNGDEDYESL